MYSFLVLGYVPGTHIQIQFQGWLDALLVLLCVLVLRYIYRQEQLRNHLPVEALLLPQLVMAHTVTPLHAELAPAEHWLKSVAEAGKLKLLLTYSRLLAPSDKDLTT